MPMGMPRVSQMIMKMVQQMMKQMMNAKGKKGRLGRLRFPGM